MVKDCRLAILAMDTISRKLTLIANSLVLCPRNYGRFDNAATKQHTAAQQNPEVQAALLNHFRFNQAFVQLQTLEP